MQFLEKLITIQIRSCGSLNIALGIQDLICVNIEDTMKST